MLLSAGAGPQRTRSYRSIIRVTVSALLSLVGPAHQLLLPIAAFKCHVFQANQFDLI